jgi:hypothetical protein
MKILPTIVLIVPEIIHQPIAPCAMKKIIVAMSIYNFELAK